MRVYQFDGVMLASTDSHARLKSQRMQATEVLDLLTNMLDRSVSGYLVHNIGHVRPFLGKIKTDMLLPGWKVNLEDIVIEERVIAFRIPVIGKTFKLKPVGPNAPLVWQGQSLEHPEDTDDVGSYFMRVTVVPQEVTYFDFSKMCDALPVTKDPETVDIRRSLLVSTQLANAHG